MLSGMVHHIMTLTTTGYLQQYRGTNEGCSCLVAAGTKGRFWFINISLCDSKEEFNSVLCIQIN